jgi:PhzF family phenazine biosynthesis protein
MKSYAFRIVNVFAEAPLAGNPLAVFENGGDFDDATMQALALQFNLSETTFVLPSTVASARVRIFTPTFELPFAGHPTLGSAHVVRDLLRAGDDVALEMRAGVIPVRANGNVWTLTANAPRHRAPHASREQLASMLSLTGDDLADTDPLWIDTGTEQLIIPLKSFDAVRRAAPSAERMRAHGSNGQRAMAYVFARDGDNVLARFFFPKHDAILEDPGTGSACANLGGYLIATKSKLPVNLVIDQGEAVSRRCRLMLRVGEDKSIQVSGRVIELGRGSITL